MTAEIVDLFTFDDYRLYLEALLSRGDFGDRAPRTRLASCCGCQVAYVSQVLGGQTNFNLEQAEKISTYLKHLEPERSYFFDLIQWSRAGTVELKTYFKERVLSARKKHQELASRLVDIKEIPIEHRATYYGSWYHAAIHMIVHIPSFRSLDAIANRLALDHATVQRSLDYLLSLGLIALKEGFYLPTEVDLHLSRNSPFLAKHLYNWRVQAMRALDAYAPSNLHYSSVMTLHPDDVDKIREILTKSIEKSRKITKDSRDETSLFVINMDFFEI